MRLRSIKEKIRKSLGLQKPGKLQTAGRFNIALVILEEKRDIDDEMRSMVEKLKVNDVSTSMI